MAVGQLKNRPRPRTPPGSLSMALEPKLHDGHRNVITQLRNAAILVFRLPLNRPRGLVAVLRGNLGYQRLSQANLNRTLTTCAKNLHLGW